MKFASQYMPVVAQHQYQARRAYCKPHNRLEHSHLLEHVKHRLLECQWSPEEIAGWLRAEYGKCIISATTIYRAIYNGWLNAPKASTISVIKKLRHRGKRRKKHSTEEKRGKIKISHDITYRTPGRSRKPFRNRPLGSRYRCGPAGKSLSCNPCRPKKSLPYVQQG